MRVYIYPGTFDPITKGHIDIMKRASSMCDKLIMSVFDNKNKNCMFSLQERIKMIEDIVSIDKYSNVEVISFDTLLVSLTKKFHTSLIIRGIRNANDFEYEQNLFQVNRTLCKDFETMFLMAKNDNKHISSSVARELIALNGDYSSFVHQKTMSYIKDK